MGSLSERSGRHGIGIRGGAGMGGGDGMAGGDGIAGGDGMAGGAGIMGPPGSGAGICGAGDSVTGADEDTVGSDEVGTTVDVDVSVLDVVVVTDVVVLSFDALSPHAARLHTASASAPTHTVRRSADSGFGMVRMVESLSFGSIVAADTRYPTSHKRRRRDHDSQNRHGNRPRPPIGQFGFTLCDVIGMRDNLIEDGNAPDAGRVRRARLVEILEQCVTATYVLAVAARRRNGYQQPDDARQQQNRATQQNHSSNRHLCSLSPLHQWCRYTKCQLLKTSSRE